MRHDTSAQRCAAPPGKMEEEEEEQRLGDEFFEPLRLELSLIRLFSYMDGLYEMCAPVGVSRLIMRGSD